MSDVLDAITNILEVAKIAHELEPKLKTLTETVKVENLQLPQEFMITQCVPVGEVVDVYNINTKYVPREGDRVVSINKAKIKVESMCIKVNKSGIRITLEPKALDVVIGHFTSIKELAELAMTIQNNEKLSQKLSELVEKFREYAKEIENICRTVEAIKRFLETLMK